jgi:hypothetical protein
MAIGQAISDIGAYFGAEAKAGFDITEGEEYDLAADLARKNEQYTKMSTAIKGAQSDRELALNMGRTHAEVAGAGFAESGSALDILRSSASQGALQHAAISEQGLITEAGYEEQAQSYSMMAGAARQAASAEKTAGIFDLAAAAGSVADIFLGGGSSTPTPDVNAPLPGSMPMGQGGIGSA